jgi:hypothetical protein
MFGVLLRLMNGWESRERKGRARNAPLDNISIWKAFCQLSSYGSGAHRDFQSSFEFSKPMMLITMTRQLSLSPVAQPF